MRKNRGGFTEPLRHGAVSGSQDGEEDEENEEGEGQWRRSPRGWEVVGEQAPLEDDTEAQSS